MKKEKSGYILPGPCRPVGGLGKEPKGRYDREWPC